MTDEQDLGASASGFDPSRDRLQVLRDVQAACSLLIHQALPEGHRCGPVMVSQERWETMEAMDAAEDAALAALMPTEQDAIRLMHDCYTRLKKLGWNDAMYCPKDGSTFDAIEVGSTGIFPTHYSGEWPDGHWWAEDGGDLWPAKPCLYRVSEEEKARWKGLGEKLRGLRDKTRDRTDP